MGFMEYGFALFIFILACLFALLCKYLFGRTKNRLQALDEKEKKLLAFYSTLEDMMDEFNESAVQANTELAQQIAAMRNVAASLRPNTATESRPPQQPSQPQQQPQPVVMRQQTAPAMPVAATIPTMPTVPAAGNRPLAAMPGSTAGNSRGFDAPVFEVVSEAQPVQQQQPEAVPAKTEPDRPTRILNLHRNGMDRLLIAKELSVTLSEVDLVLGIAGQR